MPILSWLRNKITDQPGSTPLPRHGRAPWIEIGACYRFALPDGRWAYCQHIHVAPDFGYVVRVFDRITGDPLDSPAELEGAGLLFPPVFAAMIAARRYRLWHKIGVLPVNNFVFPKFRQTMGTKPGTYHDWRIWDGKKTTVLGDLPIKLRSLELKCVWACEGLGERIVAGTYRGDLMF
jgi:hypothetical protein